MLQNRLRQGAVLFQPTICKPRSTTLRELEYLQEMGITVPDWQTLKAPPAPVSVKTNRPINMHNNPVLRGAGGRSKASAPPHQGHQLGGSGGGGAKLAGGGIKLLRAVKSKANGSGRTYTSRYRGVHQTFPTKRWEAQFRRNGKPTSLGCFDHEEEAARAYDKMMLWCELHNAAGVKSGITNFDPQEYEKEFAWLQSITQDELIETLRSEGRRQAAHRMMRQKREGQADPNTDDYDDSEGGGEGGGGGGRGGGRGGRGGSAAPSAPPPPAVPQVTNLLQLKPELGLGLGLGLPAPAAGVSLPGLELPAPLLAGAAGAGGAGVGASAAELLQQMGVGLGLGGGGADGVSAMQVEVVTEGDGGAGGGGDVQMAG
ncbi:hypothetical protein HYH02_005902 [Chlamydomonas schloesseri]|uniref:AP2/ERF domain-containing protein n=1 Tax=Chlamydomonas schloesseri TaxID=2026947 RepID=A0A835WKK1_9CHLO|nr:hypothetical protein HYH02_005902 [Chlamydomonas schloesseri]|eukprot:KAG2449155.1 hypothetical protein HYH02_005902 [Chlamydomonas schloesseri]